MAVSAGAVVLVLFGCALVAFAVTLRGVPAVLIAALGGFLVAIALFAIDLDRGSE